MKNNEKNVLNSLPDRQKEPVLERPVGGDGQRLIWLDILKGFTMCLVVYGHVVFDQSSNIDQFFEKLIISFHMFLFFALSGFTFTYEKSSASYIKKRAVNLMIPYFIWGIVIGWLVANARLVVKGSEISWDGLIYQIFTFQLSYLACWFLQVLFCVYVIEVLLGLMFKHIRNTRCENKTYVKIRAMALPLLIIHVIFLMIGYLVPDSIENLFRFRQIFVASFFFWLGMVLRELVDLQRPIIKRKYLGWIAVLIAVIGAMLNNKVTFSTASFDNCIITTIVAGLFCYGFIVIFSNSFRKSGQNSMAIKIENIFATLGRHTLEIMITHGIMNYGFRMVEKVIGLEAHTFPPILALIIIMVAEYVLIRYVYERKCIKRMFGKFA